MLDQNQDLPQRKRPSRLILALIGLGVCLIACVIFSTVLLGSNLLPGVLQKLQPTPGPKSSGPSASWSTMLTLADTEAAKIDKNAMLSHIIISVPDHIYGVTYTEPTTGSLELAFDYSLPNGDNFYVEFEDAVPQKTLRVLPSEEGSGPNEEIYKQIGQEHYKLVKEKEPEFRQVLASTKITPRDAVQRTWAIAQATVEKQGLQNVKLNPDVFVSTSDRPMWNVDYSLIPSKGPGTPTSSVPILNSFASALLGGSGLPSYTVDMVTGQVTDITNGDNTTPTPSSTP